MRKTKLASITAALALAVSVYATPSTAMNVGVGVSGAYTSLETSGTETLKSSSALSSGSTDTFINIPSIFLQLDYNGFVLGIEHIPVTAVLGQKTTSRGDNLKGTAGTAPSVDQDVQAEVEDHLTYYLETPGFGLGDGNGVYLMGGFTEFDIKTNEALGTGASYPDVSVDGWTYGLGVKQKFDNGFFLKALGTYTEYDDISIASTGSDAATTITADIEAYAAKVALGYNF